MSLDPALVLPLVMSVLLASCSKPSTTAEVIRLDGGDTQSIEILRESAREVLDRNCGECHTSALPTAIPRALAVYDLSQLDWSRRMSAGQLRDAEGRLREPLAPTVGKEEAREVHVSDDELDRFHHYVELELAKREHVR
jgi:hypothetical protein